MITGNGTNKRRHGRDLHIPDNDLITARDCKHLVSQIIVVVITEYDDAVRKNRQAAFDALPWWRRFLRGAS